jgi:predicted MPP superfamily phosphohydrolase
MNIMVPIREPSAVASADEPNGSSRNAARALWAERRRAMDRAALHISPDKIRKSWEGRLFSTGIYGFSWTARLLGIYARGRRNALAIKRVERDFFFPDLPAAFDGYRILHLSDTHLDCLPELAAVARRLLSHIEVDLVAVTGDIHGHYQASLTSSVAPLMALLEGVRARDGVFAVLGNHDPAGMADALEQAGLTVLINESTTVERDGEEIVLTGLDDVHRFYTVAAQRALAAKPAGFGLALVHSAEMADYAAEAGFALYLCGHTHGGQICLPGGRSIFTRLRRCHFGARGEWRAGKMIGYTSNGLGVGEVPLRFNCRGEVTVITLRKGKSEV